MLVAMIDEALDLSAKVTVEWPGSNTCERNSLAQMVLDVLFTGAYAMKLCSLEQDQSMCNAHTEWQMTTNDAATERIIKGLSGAICEENDMDEKGSNRYPAHRCDEFYTRVVLGGADIDTTRDNGCATPSCDNNGTQKRQLPPLKIEMRNESDHEEVIDEDREHEDIVSTPGNSPRDLYDLNTHEEMEPVWWFGRGDEDYAAPGQLQCGARWGADGDSVGSSRGCLI